MKQDDNKNGKDRERERHDVKQTRRKQYDSE